MANISKREPRRRSPKPEFGMIGIVIGIFAGNAVGFLVEVVTGHFSRLIMLAGSVCGVLVGSLVEAVRYLWRKRAHKRAKITSIQRNRQGYFLGAYQRTRIEEDIMSNLRKEVAKFACGFETFHTLSHAFLWLSGTTITFLGFSFGLKWNIVGTIVNAIIAVWLGRYAWRPPFRQSGTQNGRATDD